MHADQDSLMELLGHRFANREILNRALTHRSHSSEVHPPARETAANNEQLEFLGDAVLGFLVSELLVGRYPQLSEGRLSRLKAHLVSASHLHDVAQGLNLGQYLLLGRGEDMSGGRQKRTLLADALEAVISAIYLDGGIEAARRFVGHVVVAGFDPTAAGPESPLADFKSALQEKVQRLHLPHPKYVAIREHGPEHAKTFTVEVRIGKSLSTRAEGVTKKEAGRLAAATMLAILTDPAFVSPSE
jgi:ribonuclease-3